mgnify:CR=1 FL=1|jgi:hypothetical protein
MNTIEQIYSELIGVYREFLQDIEELKSGGDPSESVPGLAMEAWGFAQALATMRLLQERTRVPSWELIQVTAYEIEKDACNREQHS